MGNPEVTVAGGSISPLLAGLVAAGLREGPAEAATGLPFGAAVHQQESGGLSVPEEDLERLRRLVARAAGTDGRFWDDHAQRCTAAGDRLVATARSLARAAGAAPDAGALAESLAAYAGATRQAAPFLVATPVVRAELESRVAGAVAAELPEGQGRRTTEEGLRLLAGLGQDATAPVEEIRAFYRMVLEIMDDAEVLALLRSTSPAIAVNRLQSDFVAVYERMRDHARAWGWLRTPGLGCAPHTPKELVERMQVAVLRWDPGMVRRAARGQPPPQPEAVLGFSPAGPLAALLSARRALAAAPGGRIDVHRTAACLAAPWFARLAAHLGCSREQLLLSPAEAVASALAGGAELPAPPVHAEAGEARGPAVTGMTASRGRTVGRVLVILAAPQVHRLEPGDVLVTATSTPDAMGGESVFPTRAGPPLGIDHAAAIVADEGGFLSHAAIVARERGIPCVVGTERATEALSDGQVVEVDAIGAVGTVTVIP